MKNIKFVIVLFLCIAFFACSDDEECKTCEMAGVSFEICEDGNDIIITSFGIFDTLPDTSLSSYVAAFEAGGGTCE